MSAIKAHSASMFDTSVYPPLQRLPNGFSFAMIPVRPGVFRMGGEDKGAYGDESPVHPVTIDYLFYIGQFPVTQDLWLAVMGGENPSYFKGGRRPVERVSWYDAVVFCNALNAQCGYGPVYFSDPAFQQPYCQTQTGFALNNEGPVYRNPDAPGYRLPSEAEWEYAARGGPRGSKALYTGSDVLDEVGWYEENSHGETKPVGLKLPNKLGIFDMSGNVWEWCEDHWHSKYDDAPDDGSAWVDVEKQGDDRVLRGGCWVNDASYFRSSHRELFMPNNRLRGFGFRLVLVSHPV